MLIELNQVIPEPIPKEMIERSEVWETQLKIEPKSFTLISAHSGKGKSTLLHLLYGLRKDFSGEVIMDGENIQKQRDYNDERHDHFWMKNRWYQRYPTMKYGE